MASTRLGHLTAKRFALPLALVVLLASACSTGASGTEEMWIADNLVQCNDFDEPFRECLLVSQTEFDLYRHIEGGIEGFEFVEGTKYHLRVESIDAATDRAPSYRLVEIISTKD